MDGIDDGIIQEEDSLFHSWFSHHDGDITYATIEDIDSIRRNHPTFKELFLRYKGNYFDVMNWKLLGSYIVRNTHLEGIYLSGMYQSEGEVRCFLSEMPFGSLSKSLKHMEMGKFNTNHFELLVRALSGGPLETLHFEPGDIDSIEVLNEVELPHLVQLGLSGNKIVSTLGLEKCVTLENISLSKNPINSAGCIGVSKLLKSSTSVKEIDICNTDIDDEGADMLANSLKNNQTCYLLEIEDSYRITQKGAVSFIKLMSDISSIESTYNSNHILSDPCLISLDDSDAAKKYVKRCLEMNGQPNNINIGRSKVIEFQLNSVKREELHRLQGIEYCFSSIFSEIDPLVLPDVLSLVSREHAQTELHRMLVNSVSDLFSTVNRKVVLNQKLAKKKDEMAILEAQMAALSAEISEINVELQSIEEEEGTG